MPVSTFNPSSYDQARATGLMTDYKRNAIAGTVKEFVSHLSEADFGLLKEALKARSADDVVRDSIEVSNGNSSITRGVELQDVTDVSEGPM